MPASIKCQEIRTYASEDGELITDHPSLPQRDVFGMMRSSDTCLKVKTIIYYENNFRDEFVGQGNDPIARYILVFILFNLKPWKSAFDFSFTLQWTFQTSCIGVQQIKDYRYSC